MAKKDQAPKVADPVVEQEELVTDTPVTEPDATETFESPEAPEQEQAEPVTETVAKPSKAASDDTIYVTVTVPKAFKLRTTHDHIVDYAAGICEMPVEHAEHWYAVANGVTIYKK